MSLPITSIVLNSNGSWTFNWASTGAASYRVVLQGVQLATVSTPTYTWSQTGFAKYPPPIEVIDSPALVLSEQCLPYLVIQWYGEACAQYFIQQYQGSSWVTISTIQEGGSWIYSYQTQTLSDETTYNYRVVAVDSIGNQATPRQYQRYVICPPLFVDTNVALSYAANTITVVSA